MTDKNAIAAEVLGSCMGVNELRKLGQFYGLKDEYSDDIDLQVAIICEDEGVWRCDTCDWWVEVNDLHNGICSDCFSESNE